MRRNAIEDAQPCFQMMFASDDSAATRLL